MQLDKTRSIQRQNACFGAAFFCFSAIVSAQTVTPPAGVSGALMEPGFWEVSTRPDFPGVPVMPVPKIDKLCLSAADIAAGKVLLRSAPTCQVLSGKWKEKRLDLDIKCDDAPSDARIKGELSSDGKSFSGQIDLLSNPSQDGPAAGHFIYHHAGKWLANVCPPPKMILPTGPVY